MRTLDGSSAVGRDRFKWQQLRIQLLVASDLFSLFPLLCPLLTSGARLLLFLEYIDIAIGLLFLACCKLVNIAAISDSTRHAIIMGDSNGRVPDTAAVILWILLLLASAVSPCPSVCECKWKGGKQTVECRNRGLITLPNNIDPETQVSFNCFHSLTSLVQCTTKQVSESAVTLIRCPLNATAPLK